MGVQESKIDMSFIFNNDIIEECDDEYIVKLELENIFRERENKFKT